ncbi:MAG: ParA family protein [Armatimonadota bacterium]
MRTLVIASQKGGSGKTTTAVNLAAALAEQNRRVMLVDLDPQCSASAWYAVTDAGEGLLGVFDGKKKLTELVWETDTPGVDVVPSCNALAGYELRLSREIGAETLLRAELDRLPAGMWDYVLVDSPPTLGLLTLNALTAVREVIVPVEARAMALAGLGELKRTVDHVRQRLNPDLNITGILACCVNRTRLAIDVVATLRRDNGPLVYRTIIRENVRIAEAPSYQQPITQYDTLSNAAVDYRSLAAEVIAQEGRL